MPDTEGLILHETTFMKNLFRLMEAWSGMVVARGQGEGSLRETLVEGYRVSVMQGNKS